MCNYQTAQPDLMMSHLKMAGNWIMSSVGMPTKDNPIESSH